MILFAFAFALVKERFGLLLHEVLVECRFNIQLVLRKRWILLLSDEVHDQSEDDQDRAADGKTSLYLRDDVAEYIVVIRFPFAPADLIPSELELS